MKRRTEINIELTRTLLIRRPVIPCACAACAANGEAVAPDDAAVMAESSTCLISRRTEADQTSFAENAGAGEAIEIESAEGQLILAAAVRSLERRLSTQDCAALSVPSAPTAPRWSHFSRRLYANLCWLCHLITHPTTTRRSR